MKKKARKIFLGRNGYALVDWDDFDWLSQWRWFNAGNRVSRNKLKSEGGKGSGSIRMHRQIMQVNDPRKCIDHVNGDPFDNRRENLRICTQGQNNKNRSKFMGQSKYKGVYWCRRTSRWKAGIKNEGVNLNLGSFKTEAEAAIAYDDAALKMHGEFARTNLSAIQRDAVRLCLGFVYDPTETEAQALYAAFEARREEQENG